MYRSTIALIAVAMSLAISTILAADNNPFQAGDEHGTPAAKPFTNAERKAIVEESNRTAEQKIQKSLDMTVDLDYEATPTPLNQVIEYLNDRYRIRLTLDQKSLKEAGVDPTTTMVAKTLKDISLRSALRLILQEYNLTYVIKDEVLQITTTETASSILATRMYDVRDLTATNNNVPDPKLLKQLIDVVEHTVEPESWKTDKNSSAGEIRSFCSSDICVLVVFQTYDVHDQIAALLDELRTHKSPKTVKE